MGVAPDVGEPPYMSQNAACPGTIAVIISCETSDGEFLMPSQTMPGNNDLANPANFASLKEGMADKAGQAGAALTETAQRVGDQARETASSLASDAQQRFHGYMDQQVAAGADLARRVASAIKTAADELDPTSPALSGMVRGAGEKVQELSQQFRDKSADEILADTRAFVRRKPVLVFGAAAALGFVAYRVLNAGMTQSASHEQRYVGGDDGRRHPSDLPSRNVHADFAPDRSSDRIHAD
jgi:ElaB/YqjD/DUF883 family membrane-anchored ribosome-binding protein